MNVSQNYILIVGQPPKLAERSTPSSTLSSALTSTLGTAQALHCPVVITHSPEQAIAKAQSDHPYLVILSGDASQTWSPQVARQIRQSVQPEGVVIVALTQSSEQSWNPIEDSTEIDGFFVEPLSVDVLSALNASAILRHRN